MDLRKNSKQIWLAGGFPMNDHELANTGPKEVHSTDYVDMTPLGNKLEFSPSFASNATDEEKSGKKMLCTFPKYIPHLTALKLDNQLKLYNSRMFGFDANRCLRSDIWRYVPIE